jgi:isoquinoline 1-oxidoreductase beta subunit
MLYAAVQMAPVVGARRGRPSTRDAMAMPGVVKVVDLSARCREFSGAGAGVAVVAKTWWQAKQAAPRWRSLETSPHAGLSSAAIFADFAALLDKRIRLHLFRERQPGR